MRDRVQKKRAMALERARREEVVKRLHEDRRIRQEVGSSTIHSILTNTCQNISNDFIYQ